MALRALLRRMTWLDRAIVLLLVAAIVGSFLFMGQRPRGDRLIVEQGGEVIYTAPLDIDRRIALEGPLGPTLLVIEGGRACIVASPCPHKVCIGMGEVARGGDLVACVPNDLLITVEGKTSGEKNYDLLTR